MDVLEGSLVVILSCPPNVLNKVAEEERLLVVLVSSSLVVDVVLEGTVVVCS